MGPPDLPPRLSSSPPSCLPPPLSSFCARPAVFSPGCKTAHSTVQRAATLAGAVLRWWCCSCPRRGKRSTSGGGGLCHLRCSFEPGTDSPLHGGGGEKEECAKGPNRGGRGKTGRWHPFAALHLSWEGAPCVPSVPPVLAYLAIFVVPTKVCRWQLQVAGTNVSQAAPRRPLPPPPRVPLPGCSCQTSAPLSEWPQQPPHNCMKKPPTPRRHLGGDPKGEGRPAGERGFQATCFSPPTSTPPPKCCSRDLIPPRASPSLYCVQAPGRAGGGGVV